MYFSGLFTSCSFVVDSNLVDSLIRGISRLPEVNFTNHFYGNCTKKLGHFTNMKTYSYVKRTSYFDHKKCLGNWYRDHFHQAIVLYGDWSENLDFFYYYTINNFSCVACLPGTCQGSCESNSYYDQVINLNLRFNIIIIK